MSEDSYPKYRVVRKADWYEVQIQLSNNNRWARKARYNFKWFAILRAKLDAWYAEECKQRYATPDEVVWGPYP